MTYGNLTAQAAFLACGLIMLGLIFFSVGVLSARTGKASLNWQAAPGQVIDSRVEWDSLSGRDIARVRYTYSVNGKDYQSARVSYRQAALFSGPQSALARAEAGQYSPGQAVTVYYDPTDLSRAVLEQGTGSAAVLPLGVGGLFFVLGLIAGIAALFSGGK